MTVPNPSHERAYPLIPPTDDSRFSLGVVFDVARILAEHGFPEITSGGDLVALQRALYGFLYAPPSAVVLENSDSEGQAARVVEEAARSWGYAPRVEDER